MAMDLISGIVIVTSVFLVSLSLAALFTGLATREAVRTGKDGAVGNVDGLEWLVTSRARVLYASLFVVYTLVMTEIFVISQQTTLAFLSFAAGAALVAVQFIAVPPHGASVKPSDQSGRDDWNR